MGAEATLPLILGLRGELGAGKSVLARAVAHGAGVHQAMPSPTFNLLFRYDAPARRAEVYHLDLFRLNHADDVWELGWAELGESNQIVLIEWPERAEQLLPAARWDITLTVPSAGSELRELRAVRRGTAPALPEP